MPRADVAATQLAALRPTIPFGLPNLRRNVCPHFYMTGPRGPIPVQTPHLLKAYMRQEGTIARCQVRGGVHLDAGYVTDVCLSARFNQCVFYEEEIARLLTCRPTLSAASEPAATSASAWVLTACGRCWLAWATHNRRSAACSSVAPMARAASRP